MAQTFSQFLNRVSETLDRSSIPYMVVGSVASMYYGEARLTRDLDVVIAVEPAQLPQLTAAFPVSDFYVPPKEVLIDAVINRGMFNIIHLPSALKVDFVVQKRSSHAVAEFARRLRQTLLPGLDVWMAAPEDVIIKKLVFFREGGSERHLRDIAGVLARTKVDQPYLDKWVRELGLQAEWAKAAPHV